MAQFTFKTKKLPQIKGINGAHWEKLPLSSIPPIMDISIPGSTANALAANMSNIADSVKSLNKTLEDITQSTQNLACSIGEFVDSLKGAQKLAEEFAKQNNKTRVYVRQIGLDPVGTINSYNSFIKQVRLALLDTGPDEDFKIPKVVAAEIPLDPNAIASALGSNQTPTEKLLGGGTNTLLQKKLDITISVGLNLPKLSNDKQFQPTNQGGGFIATGSNAFSYQILSINKVDEQIGEISLKTSFISLTPDQLVIQGTNFNDGTFKVVPNSVKKSPLSGSAINIRYYNKATNEFPTPNARVFLGNPGTTYTISAADKIKSALEQAGYYNNPDVPKTISASKLMDVLVEYNILNTNQDSQGLESDKSIALERLGKLLVGKTQTIGGILLVGRAPNIASLVRKVQILSITMEWLKPLSEKLATSALAQVAETNPSGIDFDPTNINLSKLNKDNNVGKKDAQDAAEKIKNSGVQEFELPTLQGEPVDYPKGNFNIWRKYSPIQLIPSLTSLGQVDDTLTDYIQSTTAAAIASTTGTLGNLIDAGKQKVDSFANSLDQASYVIDKTVDEINALSDKMVQGLNTLKNLTGAGPTNIEGHLIGQTLSLKSNEEFILAVEQALNDYSDPNRPTFGSSPSPNFLETQNQLKAALQGGVAPTNNTTIWFGLVIAIVGRDRQDLGEQMRTIANFLNMDTSSIVLPPKPKFPSGDVLKDIKKGLKL